MAGRIDLRKLPPLKALRGFEVAARLGSFRAAAEELNLTHTAISHQVRSLEENLGVLLFRREGRSVRLTRDGEAFYPEVRDVLERLVESAEALRRSGSGQRLHLQAFVTLSIHWLSHRLSRFRARHPELDLQIISSILDNAFDGSLADVGMVYAADRPGPGLHWTPLFDAELKVVCAPELIAGRTEKMTPEALLGYPLLSVYTAESHWAEWFASLGLPFERAHSAIEVDTIAIALEMALDGEGMAMLNGPFGARDLAAGRLVQPVDHVARAPGGWGLVCPREMKDDPRVRAFADWLVADLAEFGLNPGL